MFQETCDGCKLTEFELIFKKFQINKLVLEFIDVFFCFREIRRLHVFP